MQHFETPAVEIKSLEKCYGAHRVLHSVSLQAHQGEVISILGASGSGKSTLLRCINMLEVPDAGSVAIHGETYKLDQQPDVRLVPLTHNRFNGCVVRRRWCSSRSICGRT